MEEPTAISNASVNASQIIPIKPKREGYNNYKPKYSKRFKNELVKKAIELASRNELNVVKLASKKHIPEGTLRSILSNDTQFEDLLKKRTQYLKVKALESAGKDLDRQEELRPQASYGQLTASFGTKWDKVHPPIPNLQQINVDRDIKVELPPWASHNKDKDSV